MIMNLGSCHFKLKNWGLAHKRMSVWVGPLVSVGLVSKMRDINKQFRLHPEIRTNSEQTVRSLEASFEL